ncbi:MAG: aconitase X, partial [bacterium]
MLAGEKGPGCALAMTVVTKTAIQMGATRLLDISSAHIDSCLFHGIAGLDFARRLLAGGAKTAVPATLNVGALDLLHP